MEKVVTDDANIQPTESVLEPAKTKIKDVAKLVADKPVMNNMKIIITALIVILAGVATGWFLSGTSNASSTSKTPRASEDGATTDVMEIGEASEDNEMAEGELLEAEEDSEGTHFLSREDLGENKDVALVSTVLNLQDFVGKRVTVWGETKAGQSSGWLMDVVKIKVVQ